MLYSNPVTQGDDDSTVWRKLCFAAQQGLGAAPVNLTAPQLSDATPDEGTSVSVSDGTWSGSPTSFTYQWFLDGVLQGETGNTFAIPSSTGGQEVYAVVTAHNATGSTPAQSDIGTVQTVDPLDGIAYRMRFETTWDGVTLRPMWQDVSRTTLVVSEGDPVATMGPDDAEFTPEQPDGAEQGILFLAGDGTPYIDLDGIDDWYEVGSITGQVTYTCLLRSKTPTFNNFWSPADNADANADRWGFFSLNNQNFLDVPGEEPVEVRLNGVELADPNDTLSPIDDWMVLTVTTSTQPASNKGLFQLAQMFFGDAESIAFFIYNGSPSLADVTQVETFYSTLIPA